MAKTKLTEIVTKIVNILTPLPPEERRRAIVASLTLLGDEAPNIKDAGSGDQEEDQSAAKLPQRARVWMKQNNIVMEEIEQVFHVADGTVEVIASEIPGKTDKEKTYNAYVLAGIARLLQNGNSNFDDKSARALCKSFGCFNTANHSAYLGNKGNEFTGTKEKGWVLTTPGLKCGAALVKALNKQEK
jgi:hypothetical protein